MSAGLCGGIRKWPMSSRCVPVFISTPRYAQSGTSPFFLVLCLHLVALRRILKDGRGTVFGCGRSMLPGDIHAPHPPGRDSKRQRDHGDKMLYHWYEFAHAALAPARTATDAARLFFGNPFNPLAYTRFGRSTAAAAELIERTTRRYPKPIFGIARTIVDGRDVRVWEEIVWEKPFCNVIRFRRDLPGSEMRASSRVLVVAPMSGHYATLLRGTVEGLLPFHDVYITDWVDARMVPVEHGAFNLNTYVDYLIDMFRMFRGNVHVMAVCQPSVPVLAAVGVMEANKEANVPHSMILMGGPIDTRVSKTAVNELAEEKGVAWFKRNVITSVPWPYPGYGRKVYPGFLQLTGFMSMNLDRHMTAHHDLFRHLVKGDGESAEKHREFYDEYLAVMDMTEEFYLQTIQEVFIKHSLARGTFMHNGRKVDPAAIRNVALMTVEGEKDDITGLGQCAAAHHLCVNLPQEMRRHLLQAKVGHYGIFNGSRYRKEIIPQVNDFIAANTVRTSKFRRLVRALRRRRGVELAPLMPAEYEIGQRVDPVAPPVTPTPVIPASAERPDSTGQAHA
jgi:poly(3-hydroxybutyrate) depolymerase